MRPNEVWFVQLLATPTQIERDLGDIPTVWSLNCRHTDASAESVLAAVQRFGVPLLDEQHMPHQEMWLRYIGGHPHIGEFGVTVGEQTTGTV